MACRPGASASSARASSVGRLPRMKSEPCSCRRPLSAPVVLHEERHASEGTLRIQPVLSGSATTRLEDLDHGRERRVGLRDAAAACCASSRGQLALSHLRPRPSRPARPIRPSSLPMPCVVFPCFDVVVPSTRPRPAVRRRARANADCADGLRTAPAHAGADNPPHESPARRPQPHPSSGCGSSSPA